MVIFSIFFLINSWKQQQFWTKNENFSCNSAFSIVDTIEKLMFSKNQNLLGLENTFIAVM